MFGYVVANSDKLDEQQLALYKANYCGVCCALKENFGSFGRLTLTYDMTFLAMLLADICALEPELSDIRCIVHPFKKRQRAASSAHDYAAGMNLLLAYYNLRDDWSDDRNLLALTASGVLEASRKKAEQLYPRQAAAVRDCLERLAQAESAGELNPDIPAGIFGQLMGELFVYNSDSPHAALLAHFGNALGRFIYIMDACLDFKKDLRKKRYNPMTAMTADSFEPILQMLMGQCAELYEQLPLSDSKPVLDSIIYSGVWTRWSAAHRKDGETK